MHDEASHLVVGVVTRPAILRGILLALVLMSGSVSAADPLSEPEYGVIFEQDVPIRVRDGTVLRADVYRPDVPDGETGEFPVLMSLSAYQKALLS